MPDAPRKVWIDGRFYDKPDAKINVYDHGVLYGDGVFEGIRVYNGRIFACAQHIRRLYASAKAIRLNIPLTPDQFRAAMEQTVAANGLSDCYIRALVTRGVGNLGLNPERCANPSVIIIADLIELYSRETYTKGMSVITATVIRNHPNALSPRIKSLNYLNNILAKIEAVDAGVPEAIMLNGQGNVAECTGDNIFIARDGRLMTPTITDGILEGITRTAILQLCRKLNIPALEQSIQRHDLYVADECFLTGSAAEVVAVTKIDGRVVGQGVPGPLTLRLSEAFQKMARSGEVE